MRSKLAEYNDPRLSRAFITKLDKEKEGKAIYAQDKNVEYILNDTSEEQETVLAEPEQNEKYLCRTCLRQQKKL